MVDTAHKMQTLTVKDCNITKANAPLAIDPKCIVINTNIAHQYRHTHSCKRHL